MWNSTVIKSRSCDLRRDPGSNPDSPPSQSSTRSCKVLHKSTAKRARAQSRRHNATLSLPSFAPDPGPDLRRGERGLRLAECGTFQIPREGGRESTCEDPGAGPLGRRGLLGGGRRAILTGCAEPRPLSIGWSQQGTPAPGLAGP